MSTVQCAAKVRKGHRCTRQSKQWVRYSEFLRYKFCVQHAKQAKRSGMELEKGGR